ncbi:MAG: hypothetical protein E7514_07675 [Ruminococcaceae bacterium]|nr:hypothetical protein [Oscillospiraceae bacterium]
MDIIRDFIILIPLLIQLAGLTPIVLLEKYISKKQKYIMLGIIASVFLLILQNCGDYITSNIVSSPTYRTLFSIMGYCLRPLILILFCQLVQPYKKHIIPKIFVALNALVYLTALFSGIAFYISDGNHFMRGPLSFTVYYVSVPLLIYLAYCTVYEYRHGSTSIWVAIINVAIIGLGAFLDITPMYIDYPVSYLTIAVVSCTLFYYIWLHLQYVKEHENSLMAEQRIKIMMSQIQPHFLYNTLATIQSLCLTDPKEAAAITGKFGAYLRSNLDSLEKPDLIPIKKELEHTKVYAEIEMKRFPKINVKYNIEADSFLVPALTVQPLVENAIRHGVRNREHGLVEVTTKKTDDGYVIIISDNGIGFNIDKPLPSDKSHIGIDNVKERISEMCGGTMIIDSRINKGTVITITLPEG